jgi:hypothetical protein
MMIVIIILLAIVAVGVLLASESGKKILGVTVTTVLVLVTLGIVALVASWIFHSLGYFSNDILPGVGGILIVIPLIVWYWNKKDEWRRQAKMYKSKRTSSDVASGNISKSGLNESGKGVLKSLREEKQKRRYEGSALNDSSEYNPYLNPASVTSQLLKRLEEGEEK